MKRRNVRDRLLKALDRLRRKNPAGYAQLLLLPFGPVPSYAMDDKNSEWWSSEEARARLLDCKENI